MHLAQRTAAIERNAPRQWLTAFATLAAAIALPATATAQVPDDFIGYWSTDPNRCEQINGEVDMLEVVKSGFQFYEIGCEVKKPARTGKDAVTFPAQCWKGGSPVSSGTATLRHLGPDEIDVALHGFFWTAQKPEAFRRCKAN
jgi:hypothetical protein